MNLTRHASVITVLSVLYSGNALSQSAGQNLPVEPVNAGIAAGTGYQLMATDRVAFGPGVLNETRKELLFQLSSVDGIDAESGERGKVWSGGLAFDRIDFLAPGEPGMKDLADGLSYTASIEVSGVEDFDSQSEFVSSRQLGIQYGRLGTDNYRAVDLGVRSISDDALDGGCLLYTSDAADE